MKIIDDVDVRMWRKANRLGKVLLCIIFPLKFVAIGILVVVCFGVILPMLYVGGTINWVGQFLLVKRVEWKSLKSCIDNQ